MTQPPFDPPPGPPPSQPPSQAPTQPGWQPLQQPTLPPSPAPGGTPGLTSLSFDWRRLVVGNWAGAGIVALLTLLTAGVLGMAVALLVKPPDLGISRTLDLATAVATASSGAAFGVSGSDDDVSFSGSLSIVPMTLTLLVLVVLVVAFRRMVRDYPRPGAALGDAARVALLVGVGLMVVAIAFRGDNDELGRGWAAALSADESGVDVDYGSSIAGSLLLGFLLTLVVLALVVVLRRDWWPERVQAIADRVTAALYGYLAIILLLPVVGLVGFLLLGFGEDSLDDVEEETNLRELLTVVFTLLANGGVWLLGLGSGARFGGGVSGDGDGETTDEQGYERLWGAITDDEPGLWASPVILLLVLAFSAFVVCRRSRSREHVFGNLLAWAGGFVVVVPLLTRLSNAHLAGQLEQDESELGSASDYDYSAVGGLHGVDATFFLLGIALVVALAAALVTGTVDVGGLRRGLSRLQATPVGVPTQQAPTQPPPGYPAPPTQPMPAQPPHYPPPSSGPPG